MWIKVANTSSLLNIGRLGPWICIPVYIFHLGQESPWKTLLNTLLNTPGLLCTHLQFPNLGWTMLENSLITGHPDLVVLVSTDTHTPTNLSLNYFFHFHHKGAMYVLTLLQPEIHNKPSNTICAQFTISSALRRLHFTDLLFFIFIVIFIVILFFIVLSVHVWYLQSWMNGEAFNKMLLDREKNPPRSIKQQKNVWTSKQQGNGLHTQVIKSAVSYFLTFSATDRSTGATMEAAVTSHDLQLRGEVTQWFQCACETQSSWCKHVTHDCNTGCTERGWRNVILEGCKRTTWRKASKTGKGENKTKMTRWTKKSRKKNTNKQEWKKAGPVRGRENNKCCSGPWLGWVGCWVTVRAQIQMMSHFLKHTGTSSHTQL